jgi:nucleoside-diphosphate-sugar epimerase
MISGLSNCKIAIVGMGYVGKNLFQYLEKIHKQLNIEIHTFNRLTINKLKGKEFDYLFSCTGNTGDFKKQIWQTVDSNITVTNFIIENVLIKKALVLLSSSRIYGFTSDESSIFKETDILANRANHLDIDFVYNGTKMLMECIALNVTQVIPYKTVIARLSNLYGNFTIEDLDDSTYLKLMIRHKLQGKVLVINQNMFDTKGYIYINDALEGILLCAVNSPGSGIYNICSGRSYSINDWVEFLELTHSFTAASGTPRHSKISIEKASKELGFQPIYHLEKLHQNQLFKT